MKTITENGNQAAIQANKKIDAATLPERITSCHNSTWRADVARSLTTSYIHTTVLSILCLDTISIHCISGADFIKNEMMSPNPMKNSAAWQHMDIKLYRRTAKRKKHALMEPNMHPVVTGFFQCIISETQLHPVHPAVTGLSV